MTSTGKNRLKLIIVMGVSGCGKSTVAKQLAQHFNYAFVEADDFHSEQAKTMMAQGIPLNNAQRAPWIARLAAHLTELSKQRTSVVMAYSGLIKAHRQKFTRLDYETQFIFLAGSQAVIESRLMARKAHFFDPQLLVSQFETLEAFSHEEKAYTIDIDQPLEQVLSRAIEIVSPL